MMLVLLTSTSRPSKRVAASSTIAAIWSRSRRSQISECDCAPAGSHQLGGLFGGAPVAVRDDDAGGTVAGELDRDRPTDVLARSGDECDLAGDHHRASTVQALTPGAP